VILELLRQHESRYQLQGIPLGLLVCDLDHFKQINDRYGHQAGDEALLHAIRCFEQVLRDTDIIGRLGGEEFVIILSNTAPAGVHSAAERFRQNLSAQQLQFIALADQAASQQITVSIGYGSMGDFADVSALLVAADQAMYRAKQNGRNQICAATEPVPV
jgi:diguanylate cyclase (GGDEF)-like protein